MSNVSNSKDDHWKFESTGIWASREALLLPRPVWGKRSKVPPTMSPLFVVKQKELSPDTLVGGSTNITSEPTVQPAVPQEQRLPVTDRTSHIRFLVDSGYEVSVIPRTLVRQKTTLSDLTLYAANQTVIHIYGKYITQLNLDLRRNFTWPFIIADVHTAIIGADFLSKFQLPSKASPDPSTLFAKKRLFSPFKFLLIFVVDSSRAYTCRR